MNLEDVIKDGFRFDTKGNIEIDLALVSLKIALKAYFSTYQTFKSHLYVFNKDDDTDQESIDYLHRNSYCEACAETIVHFQHFAELVCKKILRDDHPLLSDTALNNVDLLHRLLHGGRINDDEIPVSNTVEFSLAIKRLSKLIENKMLENYSDYEFIIKHKKTLIELNKLRNRVWHRGLFILRYPSLDVFVGKYILPFVSEILKLPSFSGYDKIWKYGDLFCALEPISEIISEASLPEPSYGKIAFLKELARAAYENPLLESRPVDKKLKSFLGSLDKKSEQRAVRIAKLEALQEHSKVENCPVCGVKSLIVYDDTDVELSDDNKNVTSSYNYTYMVKCECCSFNLESGLENASKYGLAGIPDYWFFKEST